MATLATLGQMMLNLPPRIDPYDPLQVQQQRNVAQGGQITNQTALLQLADLQRQQEAAAVQRRFIQEHPELLVGGGQPGQPMPTLATIGTQGGGAPGAITQSPLPGMPGQPQTIPAYPDASRYAGVSPQGGGPIPPDVAAQVMPTVTPPQSTIAGLTTQPQAPQNPITELMRQNPDAGLQLLDMQQKMFERQLSTRQKTAEAVASQLQGVNSQESYDQVRRDLQQWAPQIAQRLPAVWSKEAMQPFIDSALSAKDKATLDLTEMQRQTEVLKARVQAGSDATKFSEVEYKETPQGWIAVPKYPGAQGQTGGAGVGGTPVTVGGQPVTSGQEQKRLSEAQQQTRSAEFQLQGEYNKLTLPYREVRDALGRIEAAGTSPTAAGDQALIYAYMKMLDPTTGIRDTEVRNAERTGGLFQQAHAWLEWLKGGAPLKESVRKDFLDRAKQLYQQYQNDYEQTATQYREQATRQGLDPRNVVQDYRSTTAAGGRGGKVVSRAALAAEARRRGVDPAQAEQMAKAKGYTVQ